MKHQIQYFTQSQKQTFTPKSTYFHVFYNLPSTARVSLQVNSNADLAFFLHVNNQELAINIIKSSEHEVINVKDRYLSERFKPKVPFCKSNSFFLLFNGKSLRGFGLNTTLAYAGVSGRNINGKFNYSIKHQQEANEGPIPEGDYWIQPSELQSNSWYRIRNSRTAWGSHWITIHPYPTTETYGRGGFFIHGGSTPGSAGCIDLADQMPYFIASLFKLLNNTECFILLKVRYTT